MRRTTQSKLVFIGNYGNRNIGDDAILQLLSERYRAAEPNQAQYVFARFFPEDAARISHARPLRLNLRSVLWVLCHVHVVVVGGGGLFGANMGPAARFIPLFALFCRALGKRIIYESVGVYRNTPVAQRMLLFASMLTAERVSVRDATSWAVTAPLRRFKAVQLVDDPGFAITPIDREAAERLLRAEGIVLDSQAGDVVGISLKRIIRDAEQTRQLVGPLVAACQWLINQGYTLLFIPFCHDPEKWSEQDVAFAEEIMGQLRYAGGVHCVRRYYAPREVAGILRLADAVVAMRFHAQVFAHALGVPLLPIAYEEKRTDLIHKYGYPLLPVEQLSSERLIDQLDRLLRRRRSYA